jgi:prophage antirepressor-like protein
MIQSVDEDEKQRGKIFLSGQNRDTWFLTENGLYEVLMLSRKPIAKEFKKEVKKILHQLRTKGGYITEKGVGAILDNPDYLMELINESGKRLVEMKKRAEVAENKNALLMHSEKSYTISEIAKEMEYKSAIEFNKILAKDKIIFKQNGTWLPYAQYAKSGYFEIKQTILENKTVVYNLRVTQKGREFLINKYHDLFL